MTQDEILAQIRIAEPGDLFLFRWKHRKDQESKYIGVFFEYSEETGTLLWRTYFELSKIDSKLLTMYPDVHDGPDQLYSFSYFELFKRVTLPPAPFKETESLDDDILI